MKYLSTADVKPKLLRTRIAPGKDVHDDRSRSRHTCVCVAPLRDQRDLARAGPSAFELEEA